MNSARACSSGFDSYISVHRGVLIVESDSSNDSHDVVLVRFDNENPDEVEVVIAQFDHPVNPLEDFADEEEMLDEANDKHIERHDYDDVFSIRIEVYGGHDWVFVDRVQIQKPCTIIGGLGDDHIRSGSGSDTIWGDEENVETGFLGGEDDIWGYGGVDTIHGGPLDDVIDGGNQGDFLYGDNGVDTIYGGYGNDDLFGGAGVDHLYGEDGYDDLFGGNGNDHLFGGEGKDDLHGEDGDDNLYGEEGPDNLFGGNGNDHLDGAFDGEMDALVGGAGADDFVNRYYELRTESYLQAQFITVPVVVRDGFFFRIVLEQKLVWVPISYTVHDNLEFEILNDFSEADGDRLLPVQVN